MNEKFTPQDLQKLLDYDFEEPEILGQALTRKAYLSDRQDRDSPEMSPLATVGDAVLNVVIVSRLYDKGERDIGILTNAKSDQGRRKMTRVFAESHDLPKYINWGKGETKQEVNKNSTKALDTVTEALIGAIYLDAQKRGMNGMKVVSEILEKMNFFY
jgi:ribonuclease-3